MTIDLHNHTTRCNHATGTISEYIEKAIYKGIWIFGFSDHAPMEFDKKYRMGFEEMAIYEDEVKRAKEEYRGQIDIRLGYEVDWVDGFVDERVLKRDVDYFIGSIHFINSWGFDNPEFIDKYKDIDITELWVEYFKQVEAMAKSGLFDIVGHLDLVKIFKFKPDYDIREIAYDALNAIALSGMSIELNSAGLRKPVNEIYPSLELLELAHEKNIPITFGSDAHSVEQVGYEMHRMKILAKEARYDYTISYKNRVPQMHKF
jgi:histidinol-phosphatase (PHP family)